MKKLQELQQEYNSLKVLYRKDFIRHHQTGKKLIIANKELIFQNEEKEKRAAELIIANKELIIAKEKAQKSDRLKSSFLANMSHEIRTPMNSILGFSELLLNQNLTEAKQEKYYEIINSSGRRLMNLINDIVDVSKLDSQELSLNQSVFNLNKLLYQLQQQFIISPKNKSTTISMINTLSDSDIFINCDEMRLAQVFSNLLENSLKFTINGTVEIGYKSEDKKLHFYVKDSGVGINVKDHQHIFERFGKSDNEILKVKEGSGLGLAISKGIVELFGGNIWVESEPYNGATFHFTIPNCIVPQEEKSSNEKSIENDVIAITKTILIAEDEETNFWYLEAVLDCHPFSLIHVVNGKESVDVMLKNNSIDLILMDFNMPIMNGTDATIEIRKINSTIPIIALTAYTMMGDKEKALSIGFTDYLSKPVSEHLLLETINKHIH
jgi:signal transduction histidine kinase